MQIWASYARDPDDHLLTYMIDESPNGKLAQILKPMQKFLPGKSQLSFRNSPEKERLRIQKIQAGVCATLKRESLAAFKTSASSGTDAKKAPHAVTR